MICNPQTINTVEEALCLMQTEGSEENNPPSVSLPRTIFKINVGAIFEDAAQRKAVHEALDEFVEESIFVLYLDSGTSCQGG